MSSAFAGVFGPNVRIISLVGVAHMMSHVYQMTLVPLFPLLKVEFGVSYTALGLLLSVFSVSAAIGQMPVGFLVDRIGGKLVLVAGLGLQALAIGFIGFTASYWSLLSLFTLAGLAHSVYHPADYAILSRKIDEGKLARAYSIHSFSGNIGTAVTPMLMVTLTVLWGWQATFQVLGMVGMGVAAFLWFQGDLLSGGPRHPVRAQAGAPLGRSVRQGLKLLMSPPILLCFICFVVLTTSFSGVRMFSVAALVDMYDVSLETANGALTGLILGTAVGMLAGGYIADRIGPRAIIAVFGLLGAAILLVVLGTVSLPIVVVAAMLTTAGFLRGLVQGVRDMMVYAVTPKGDHGKVFAFVSTGANLGHAAMPLLFGWILDNADPSWVFLAAAGMGLFALATFITVRGRVAG